MMTRIYTPPVMSYYRAQQLQAAEEQEQQESKTTQEQTRRSTPDVITNPSVPVKSADTDSSIEVAAEQKPLLASVRETNKIPMGTILKDFQSTLNALGVDETTQQEVGAYLDVVRLQATKTTPDVGYIRQTLKTAANTMDGFISNALQQPSKVVRDWVDALLMQPIDFHLEASEAQAISATKTVQAKVMTQESATLNTADATQTRQAAKAMQQSVKQALQESKALYKTGDAVTAKKTLTQALSQIDGQQYPGLSGRVELQLGKMASDTHSYSQAQTYLQAAVTHFSQAKQPAKLAQSHLALGETLEAQGDLSLAQEHFIEAQKLSQGTDDAKLQKTAFYASNGLGAVYLRQQQPLKAQEQFLSAYQLSQKLPELSPEVSDVLSNLGSSYQRQNNTQKAEQAYRLALKYAKSEGQLDSYRATLQQLAGLYEDSQQNVLYQKAMTRLANLPS